MISRRTIAAIAFLCVLVPAHAQKTKSQLQGEINTNFPDQNNGAITPSIARTTFNDFLNSWQQFAGVNAQIGTTYTILASDYGQLVTFNNSGSVAISLPQAISGFASFNFFAENLGSGLVTITPTISTINGAPALTLATGQSVYIVSDGANYQIIRSGFSTTQLVAGAGITITGTLTPTISITNVTTPTTIGDANDIPQIIYNTQGEITSTTAISTNVVVTNITSLLSKTIAGNNSGSTGNAVALNGAQVGAILCTPVRTILLTGSNATLTPTTCNALNPSWLEVEVQGAGGAGGSSGTTLVNAGGNGLGSSFGALVASGGTGGPGGTAVATTGGAGGTCSGSLGTQQNFPGMIGSSSFTLSAQNSPGGMGGVSWYGAAAGTVIAGTPAAPPANSGGGGSGAGSGTVVNNDAGYGGGAGCHISSVIVSPLAASYIYTIGSHGIGGIAGSNGFRGGDGADGLITILQHWQ